MIPSFVPAPTPPVGITALCDVIPASVPAAPSANDTLSGIRTSACWSMAALNE